MSVLIMDKKVRTGVLFLLLILLPLSVLFVSWLTNPLSFADLFSRSRSDSPANDPDDDNYDHIADIGEQLKHMKCPAREGLELMDYWECLWRTSITTEGMQQHREDMVKNTARKTTINILQKNVAGAHSRRKRNSYDSNVYWERDKMFALTNDMSSSLNQPDVVHKCQHVILPGVSIYDFVHCLLENSFSKKYLLPTFQPTTIPAIKSSYDDIESPLLTLTDRQGEEYKFELEFDQLENEEHPSSFAGADPYLDDHFSAYRYKYNNLDSRQTQPAWSYSGLYGPSRWHELGVKKFFVPLRFSTELKDVVHLSDFAQTYPGVGAIADFREELMSAMSNWWSKDHGSYAYTRFLVPLLDRKDFEYFRMKGYIDSSYTYKTDEDTLTDIIKALEDFENETSEELVEYGDVPVSKFTIEDKIPFVEVYKTVLKHFFKVDISKYKKQLAIANYLTELNYEYDIIRQFLHAYVDVVTVQEHCVREMVRASEYRKTEDDLEELLSNTAGTCLREVNQNHSSALNTYSVDDETLMSLYEKYFERKEARKRYTLPVYPKEFPICKHNEPSPINIITEKGRKTSLRDYIFGPAAFHLNRFFMFFPLDSSDLLTVGVVDGERLTGTAVRLTGGAVRGVNLTFQYTHIRFASHWKGIGSEHLINGEGAQMELQMIFTIAGSADEIKYWHVLARVQNTLFQFREKLVIILSVLVNVLGTDEEVKNKIEQEKLNQDPMLFEPLAQAAYHFRRVPDQNAEKFEQPRGYVSKDPVFRLIDFIPNPTNGTKFFTYRGSLSWPPCFGYVLWSVFQQRLYISKRQFDHFTNIPSYGVSASNKAADNIRQIDDIRVEDELKTNDFTHQQTLVKERTIDRPVLEGFHDYRSPENKVVKHGIVGDEFYYMDVSGSTSVIIIQQHNTCVIHFLILFSLAYLLLY